MSSRSQSVQVGGRNLQFMESKYYTQFQVSDPAFRQANLFSGIVELNHAPGRAVSESELQLLLAENFDIDINQLRVVSWSRLH